MKNELRRTREALQNNFDQKDPLFITLREELERIFKKKNLSEITQNDMKENIHILRKIYDEAKELNRKNALMQAKYEQDEKYARVHKRLMEKGSLNAKEMQLHEALMQVKTQADEQLLGNHNLLDNEAYFNKMILQLVAREFVQKQNFKLDYETTTKINTLIVNEYYQEYAGITR